MSKKEVLFIPKENNDKLEEIKNYISDNKLINSSREIIIEGCYVKVPLPNEYMEWTLEVYDWVKNFCKEFLFTYPEYNEELNCSEYININIEYYLER